MEAAEEDLEGLGDHHEGDQVLLTEGTQRGDRLVGAQVPVTHDQDLDESILQDCLNLLVGSQDRQGDIRRRAELVPLHGGDANDLVGMP